TRGEPVYVQNASHAWVQATFTAGSPVLTRGDEAVPWLGGEQSYASIADPVLVAKQEWRIRVDGVQGSEQTSTPATAVPFTSGTAPETFITRGPSGTVTDPAASFEF